MVRVEREGKEAEEHLFPLLNQQHFAPTRGSLEHEQNVYIAQCLKTTLNPYE